MQEAGEVVTGFHTLQQIREHQLVDTVTVKVPDSVRSHATIGALVTQVPDEDVVATATGQDIVAGTTDESVITALAIEDVITLPAMQRIITATPHFGSTELVVIDLDEVVQLLIGCFHTTIMNLQILPKCRHPGTGRKFTTLPLQPVGIDAIAEDDVVTFTPMDNIITQFGQLLGQRTTLQCHIKVFGSVVDMDFASNSVVRVG